MRKILVTLATLALVLAACFLPEELSQRQDDQILDKVQLTRSSEEREGFAESVRLTVAEKLLLLRSGQLSELPITDRESVEINLESAKEGETDDAQDQQTQVWQDRFAGAKKELRSLQTLGGLPLLWSWDDTTVIAMEATGEKLYIDSETQVSFLAYTLRLSSGPYTVNLTVDGESGKILSLLLRWERGETPSWGYKGASGFAGAWRVYWGMDSADRNWNGSDLQAMLENPENRIASGNDAEGKLSFTYSGSTLRIPINCAIASDRSVTLRWNT